MNETRRIIAATLICLGIYAGWMWLMRTKYPAPTPSATPQATAQSAPAGNDPVGTLRALQAPTSAPWGATIADATGAGPILLGRDAPRDKTSENPFLVALRLTQRGAAIESADITDHRNTVRRGRNAPPDTYDLLAPLSGPDGSTALSLATGKLRLPAAEQEFDLSKVVWDVQRSEDGAGETARFTTRLTHDGKPLLELEKRYRLARDSRIVRLDLMVRNVSPQPQGIVLTQEGPVGLRREEPRNDDRAGYVLSAAGKIKPVMRRELWGLEGHAQEHKPNAEQSPPQTFVDLRWGGVANKYFGCLMAPTATAGAKSADYVRKASLRTLFDSDLVDLGDVTIEWVVGPATEIAPGGQFDAAFDVYLGPRDPHAMGEALAKQHDFARIYRAYGFICTFDFLTTGITSLFMLLHKLLGGGQTYGWAIVILVIIVRSLLHPLTRHSQINMMKMQKSMGRLQPKMEEIKRKFADDRQKMNAEMLELYRREGVNPAGNVMACLPMFLQMPVWVALWTTLNTAVELRHEAFWPFGFWLRDLSAPDAIYTLGFTFHVPLLNFMIGPVSSINILPFLMGGVMFAQQRYTQKLSRPAQPKPVDPNQPDTYAMQQKMMTYMTVFMSLMFYNFPSGLCVYILTSSLLGMAEQVYIRRLIKRREERGDFAPKPAGEAAGKTRMPAWLDRLQKKADEARQIRRETTRR